MGHAAERLMEVEGGRARVVALEESHAEGLWEIVRTDPGLWDYLVVRRPGSVEDMREWICAGLGARERGIEEPFAVLDRASGMVIGTTRYMDMQRENLSLEIGMTWYAADVRRTSVNTECKFLLLRRAFEELGCVRVQLKCDARNERSRAAILRIGARFEGVLRRHRVCHDGYIRDTAYHSIIAEEWGAVRGRLEAMLGR